MQLQLSAGGTPADVAVQLQRQVEQQLAGRELARGEPELAAAVLNYACGVLDDVAPETRVALSGYLSVVVSRPPTYVSSGDEAARRATSARAPEVPAG